RVRYLAGAHQGGEQQRRAPSCKTQSLRLPGTGEAKRGCPAGRSGTGAFRPRSSGQITGVTRSFLPHVLREYSLVADGQRGALVGPDGAIGWLCAPRWDSPAVFSGLLGGPGRYAVKPADPWNVWGEDYETRSLIWRGRWAGNS